MIHVRRHKRTIASGKTVTVTAHEREGGGGGRGEIVRPAPEWSRPEYVGDFSPPTASRPADGDWWADDAPEPEAPEDRELARMKAEMREWRSRHVPLLPSEPMNPQLAKALGCDTPEGREKYEHLRAYRESGYKGPLNQDGKIPDPDDPAEQRTLEILAHMRARG